MVVDANDPTLQIFHIVTGVAWVGGHRRQQQWLTVVQPCHGGGGGREMMSFWCLQRHYLAYCWVFRKGGVEGYFLGVLCLLGGNVFGWWWWISGGDNGSGGK
eukprot:15348966-Ditylum_brightwellii.AAC.1